MRAAFRRPARAALAGALVGAAGLGMLISSTPAIAQPSSDPVARPFADGTGSGSYDDPASIPANGLTYSIPLPFYRENGIYIEDAATPIHVEGGARELTLEQSKETQQTLPGGGGGGGGGWRQKVKSALGMVAKTAEKAVRDKYPFIPDDVSVLKLVGFDESSADSVPATEKVSFSVKDKLKIVPANGVAIEARPVYFKVKTVSDEWRKEPGETKPKLMAANVQSDVVVKMGWLLQCNDEKGGQRICEQGKDKDYVADTAVDPGDPASPAVMPRDLPRTGAPDNMHSKSGTISNPDFRWSATAPASCEVAAAEGKRLEGVKTVPKVRVRCPLKEYQQEPGFTQYRVKYHVEGHNSTAFDYSWEWRSSGTLAGEPQMAYREVSPDTTDTDVMIAQNGLPVQESWREFGLVSTAWDYIGFYATPKWNVEIIPVK